MTIESELQRPFYDATSLLVAEMKYSREPIVDRPPLLGEWYIYQPKKNPHRSYAAAEFHVAIHKFHGVRIGFSGTKSKFISASLPRCLFGTNSRNLASQADVDNAMVKFKEIFEQVAKIDWPRVAVKELHLVRHLPISLDAVKRSLRYSRHPRFRGEAIVRSNSLLFDGTNVSVFFYDKAEKDKKGTGGFETRCEVRLQNAEVIASLGGLVTAGPRLDYLAAYNAYRGELLKFPDLASVSAGNLYDFLSVVATTDRSFCGVPLFDIYLATCCGNAEAQARTRSAVAKRVPRITGVRFGDLLPLHHDEDPLGVGTLAEKAQDASISA